MLPVNSVDTANMVLIVSLSVEIPPMHLKAKYYIDSIDNRKWLKLAK